MEDNAAAAPDQPKKKCFVVMGFGEKTDFATGRTLDLDKTYRLIIQKAVEEAGLECIRADAIIHAGIIDKPMYELLYQADLVVADLSTSNANAIYELGVRHALKPNTTIVLAENQFKFPFDIGHLLIRHYEHLGKGIDGEEAETKKNELKQAIVSLVGRDETDSPVYTFLPGLSLPLLKTVIAETKPETTAPTQPDNGAAALLEMFKDARKEEDWVLAIILLNKLLQKMPNDSYLKQQLALAIYKSKKPTPGEALAKAKEILETLNPYQTTDPETLGLWGAIYKRFWDLKNNETDLNEAIWSYEKGFYLKNDFYNGINLAFLLNVRASISEKREAIADIVQGERIRKKVIAICNDILNRQQNEWGQSALIENDEQKFWLQATLVEAYLGTGQTEKAAELKKNITEPEEGKWVPEKWMAETVNDQLQKLTQLLAAAPECN
jgi:hypothetical protein